METDSYYKGIRDLGLGIGSVDDLLPIPNP
jgi:hypothetical protein